jgi:hypothetical protein
MPTTDDLAPVLLLSLDAERRRKLTLAKIERVVRVAAEAVGHSGGEANAMARAVAQQIVWERIL